MLERLSRQFGVLSAGVIVFAAALFVLPGEAQHEQLGQAKPPQVARMLASMPAPLSERAQDAVAESCYRSLRSTYFAALDTPRRQQVLDTCEAAMSDLTGNVPTHGAAGLVLAQIGVITGSATAGALLEESARVSPNSTWLRLRRLDISRASEALPDDAALLMTRDINDLLATPAGQQGLARRYLADTAFAQKLLAVVDTAPAPVQKAFVDAIRLAEGAE
ncbi:MAG TPA: hypothetical protein PK286_02000 [Devosia sp.]|nr:hypothetical protein [Devosia sp.]